MDRIELGQKFLQRLGESLIGRLHAGEAGVAALGWEKLGVEDCAQRWRLDERHIRMPGIIVGGIPRMIVENEHLRRFRNAWIEGMGVKLAEPCREIALLQRRDVLILEEDDLVREQRGADLGDLLI